MCAISLASSRWRCGLLERVTETISNSLSSYLILFRYIYIKTLCVLCEECIAFSVFLADLQRMIYRLVIREVSTICTLQLRSYQYAALFLLTFIHLSNRTMADFANVYIITCAAIVLFLQFTADVFDARSSVANAIRLHDWHCHQPLLISNVFWQVRWNA